MERVPVMGKVTPVSLDKLDEKMCVLLQQSNCTHETRPATYGGVVYKTHMFVCIEILDTELTFGKIYKILLCNDQLPAFLVQKYSTDLDTHTGLHYLTQTPHVALYRVSELVSPYPLSKYNVRGKPCISLKYGIS